MISTEPAPLLITLTAANCSENGWGESEWWGVLYYRRRGLEGMFGIPLETVGAVLLGVGVGFFSRELLPWTFHSWMETREAQREWYGEVATVARGVRDGWSHQAGGVHVDEATVERMGEFAERANELLDTPDNVDEEVVSWLEALYQDLNEFTGNMYARDAGDGFIIEHENVREQDDFQMTRFSELLEELPEEAEEIAEVAEERSDFGWKLGPIRL